MTETNHLPKIGSSGSGMARVPQKMDRLILQKLHPCPKILPYGVMSEKCRTEIADKFREYQNSRNIAESVIHLRLLRK